MKQRVVNVLVASEYPVYRVGMRGMLAGSSLRVIGEASSVGEVLSRVRTKRPDVLLLDLQLRGADDLAFLREAKRSQPQMQVVVVVSRERAAHLPEAINLGCSGFLTKHATPAQLVKTVRAVIHGDGVVEPGLLHELLAKCPGSHPRSRSPTWRRCRFLGLITQGRTNRQIAQSLGYSFGTVKNYVRKIMLKLAVTDRTQGAKATLAPSGRDRLVRGPPSP